MERKSFRAIIEWKENQVVHNSLLNIIDEKHNKIIPNVIWVDDGSF